MKKILAAATVLAVCLAFFAAGYAGQGPVAGDFDSYVLSLSWQPSFCQLHTDKKECASQTPGRYDAKNLVLHGLWPNRRGDRGHTYGFCGVPRSIRRFDRSATWCKMPSPPLSRETRRGLSLVMPGYASCLERHEWYKHGTCSAMDAETYFSTSVELARRFADTAFGRYISSRAGTSVDLDTLLGEFEKDFGPGSRKYVNLYCDRVDGSHTLVEVRTYLDKSLPAGSLRNMLVAPDASERGNCPSRFLIGGIRQGARPSSTPHSRRPALLRFTAN